MTGTEFVRAFANKGLPAWEAAALELSRKGELTPWPFVSLPLRDDEGNVVILEVASDVLSIGPIGEHIRLPLTPGTAQSILNLSGSLLPTPWLVYQMYRAAQVKGSPIKRVPTAKLEDFARHSALVDQQLAGLGARPGQLVSGIKKHVVVSNISQTGKVLIHGWYKPPPHPDVFDDGSHWTAPERQPQQVKSNYHGDFYVDYSHGIQAVGPIAIVNGQPMLTADLYQHPTLSKLVSNEGPIRVVRYPSRVPVATVTPSPGPGGPVAASDEPDDTEPPPGVFVIPTTPWASPHDMARLGLAMIASKGKLAR